MEDLLQALAEAQPAGRAVIMNIAGTALETVHGFNGVRMAAS